VVALAVVGALTLVSGVVGAVGGGVWVWQQRQSAQEAVAASSAFYAAVDDVPAEPGTIIRSEPLPYEVPGGRGFRIVYTSLDSAGRPIAVSGRVFIPDTPAPAGGRPVLAWAHGTVGLAPQCAPSRAPALQDTGWLPPALQHGLVVAATDFAGLGMPGDPTYLVGRQEARDVAFSVLAARNLPEAQAGTDWVVAGASQGGHAALWTAGEASANVPGLRLRGVVAAVPAAELPAIMQAQWQGTVGWVIGPYALVSWRTAYPDRDFMAAVSDAGSARYEQLAQACVTESGISGLVLERASGSFFRADPLSDPAWAATVREEMPPRPTVPMLLEQGMADTVVLAGSNALLQQRWCAAGTGMQSLWLAKTSHQDTSVVGGPALVDWALRRFAGAPMTSTCDLGVPAPVTPLPAP